VFPASKKTPASGFCIRPVRCGGLELTGSQLAARRIDVQSRVARMVVRNPRCLQDGWKAWARAFDGGDNGCRRLVHRDQVDMGEAMTDHRGQPPCLLHAVVDRCSKTYS